MGEIWEKYWLQELRAFWEAESLIFIVINELSLIWFPYQSFCHLISACLANMIARIQLNEITPKLLIYRRLVLNFLVNKVYTPNMAHRPESKQCCTTNDFQRWTLTALWTIPTLAVKSERIPLILYPRSLFYRVIWI